MMLDLVPLFIAATALRALLRAGISLPGPFPLQTATGAAIAAAANNMPTAAALHAIGPSGLWAAILSAAIGPNLLLWGSVATLICRRIARDGGTDLSPGRFTALGSVLVPVQLTVAFAGLHLTGAL
jgi:arsenical pump membrane protein